VAKQELAREPYDDYLQRLLDMGIVRVGRGGSASVFQHPKFKNIVVKIGLEGKQSCVYTWLKWCAANTNRYAPRVYHLEELETSLPRKAKGTPRMFICFMEKLTIAEPKVIKAFFKEHDYVFAQLEDKFWGIDPDNFKHVEDADLLEVLRTIRRIGYSDLKLENIMMRGKQIVFADPVY
jgi:hypothetical protein